jgi:hypothetical protein
MADPAQRTMSDEERELTRRWLKNWERVGPLLEAERLAGLEALTDAEAARIACDLWQLARPGGGDDARGLLPIKRALEKLAPER